MRKKVLFLGTQNIKEPVMNGGMQCSKRNFDLIAQVTGEDDLFSAIIWNSAEQYRHNRFFKRCGNNKESLISSIRMCRLYKCSEEKKILAYIKQVNPDILFTDTTLLGKILKKVDRTVKIVVFLHNIEVEYARHRVKKEGWRYLPAYIATAYNEKLSLKYASRVICLNHRDSKLAGKIYGRTATDRSIDLLPISFKDRFDRDKINRKDSSRELLFIGSNFGPNYDGIKWFIQNIMHKLQEYKLIIVGKDFEKVREELERDNVSVVGTVENLDDYYYKYFNIILPIKYGDGMKVKTAEAMMFGMNIFATDEALEGYEAEHVQGIFRCNSADDFIREIRLSSRINKEGLWNQDVRDVYMKNHCFDNQVEQMKKILCDW